jgi:GAF domain-containing protein
MGRDRKRLGKEVRPNRRGSAAAGRPGKSEGRVVHPAARKRPETTPARLARELKETLAQQSASSDVLRVINDSPGKIGPVFEAIVDKALQICDARFGGLWIVEGELGRPAATRNVPKAYSEFLAGQALPHAEAFGRGIARKPFNHVADLSRTESYRRRLPLTVASVELGGIRTYLAVPLHDGSALAGVLSVYRKEVQPFSERQIALLQGFAMQAEIAMKNARLFDEVQSRTRDLEELLQHQTATSQILSVISSSKADIQPVFDSIVDSAARLFEPCGATITTLDDGRLHWNASAATLPNFDIERAKAIYPIPFDPERAPSARALLERRIIEIPDIAAPDTPEFTRKAAAAGGFQSATFVPLVKQDKGIGTIILTHLRAGFRLSKKQIALVRTFADQAVIAIENVRLFDEVQARTRDLEESLQQQTTTADVLKVISRSTFDLKAVLQTLVESAATLCEADLANIWLPDGTAFRLAAGFGVPGKDKEKLENIKYLESIEIKPGRGSMVGRVLLEKRPVQVRDIQADREYELSGVLRIGNYRSALGVPLLREGVPVGVIFLSRWTVQPFTEKHVDLVTTFADQAVIAVENVRLLNELRESLQQQTATAEVLKVITRSTFNLQTVLDTLVESATRLCDAQDALIFLPSGNVYCAVARYGFTPEYHNYIGSNPIEIDRGSVVGRTVLDKQLVHVSDVLTDPEYTRLDAQKIVGYRAVLGAPLLREGNVIGVIFLTRTRPEPFTEKQIELVKTFADQAIIAIENTRLFDEVQAKTNELSESLQRQTATAEVLQVISSSPGELEPVFKAVLENATRLCDARFGTLLRFDGRDFYFAADVGTPPALAEYVRRPGVFRGLPGGMVDRILKSRDVQHTADYATDSAPGLAAKLGGARSTLGVPILKDDVLVGAIVIYRQEVRPFSDHEIALVRSFAAQAAIAIENARLFNETREALEQQTATAEVLRIISSSPRDLGPVFEAMLSKAMRICDAKFGHILLHDGKRFHAAHLHDVPPSYRAFWDEHGPIAPEPNTGLGQLARTKEVVHIPDLKLEALYAEREPLRVVTVDQAGARSFLAVPMLKETSLVGAIVIYRQEVRPFTEKQIELVKNFADQAVIAIENTRLFDEVQARTRDLEESLQQQIASGEVLKVIGRSAFDLNQVFETVVESSVRLCAAERAIIFRYDGEVLRVAKVFNAPERLREWLEQTAIRPGRHSVAARAALERRTVQIHDVRADPEHTYGAKFIEPFRTVLGVPMLKGDDLLGVILVYHNEVRPFTDKQILLVSTFAEQAAIAIENARLFDEVQARTHDLQESLQQQTATSEVLQIISSSPGDLAPVFESMLANATRICGANFGQMNLYEGGSFHPVAHYHVPIAYAASLGQAPFRPHPQSGLGRVARTHEVVHIEDIRTLPPYLEGNPSVIKLADLAGARSYFVVPMVKESELIGAITIYRQEVKPFTAKQTELVAHFARQAVIAIENTRLLKELRQRTDDLSESLQQQTATADVLKVISSSPGELEPVFRAMLENATRICDAGFSNLFLLEGDAFRAVAVHGEPVYVESWQREPVIVLRDHPGVPLDRLMRGNELLHIHDLTVEPAYMEGDRRMVALVESAGARTMLLVPMLRENALIGAIVIYRQEARAFTDKQIELVKNFASQAVIAFENARLLNELRESLQRQTATADVLKTISRSTFDLPAVLHALVETAAKLCDADKGTITRQKDGAFYRAESYGFSEDFMNFVRDAPVAVDRHTATGRALLEGVVVHIPDVEKDPDYSFGKGPRLGDYRALLGVPMLREGIPIGVIALTRTEPRAFTDKQIELATTFADQAAIAIQNVRLFEEVQAKTRDLEESLQQQTATAEVLKVISRSPDKLKPVLDVIVETSRELCGAHTAVIFLLRDRKFHDVAESSTKPEYIEAIRTNPISLNQKGSILARAAREKRTVHIPNSAQDPEAGLGGPLDSGPARSLLSVPLILDGRIIGGITLQHARLAPFTTRQIEAVETFADQAVIAISNVNLFEQVQQRTRELSKSLEDLRAAQDRLVQTEKLASLGQLTAGIAHEIKNPLNFVNNFSALSAELVDEMDEVLESAKLKDSKREELNEIRKLLKSNLEKVVQHGKRADSIVKNMLLHSRSGSGERRAVEINAIMDESLNLAYHGARAEKQGFNITMERDFDPKAGVAEIYPQEITRALLNLVSNGFYAATKRAAEAGNGFEPKLRAVTRDRGDKIEIRIRDNGTGIPAEIREKIFNPFFTTKPAGEGTGLGLSMCHDIVVKQHGGVMDVASEPGAFTEFIITLPRNAPAQTMAGEQKH